MIKSCARLFADDLIMYSQIHNNNDITNFQKDLDKLNQWSQKWEMNFNINKCHLIKISRNKVQYKHKYSLGSFILPYCDQFTYLGVTITSDLNWNMHINNISRKATNMLNFVKRNLYFASSECKSKAYTTLVRPHLEYASASWDPYYHRDILTLQKVQNRAARFAKNNYCFTTSVSKLNSDLGWPTLESRRLSSRLCELFKSQKGDYCVPSALLQKAEHLTRSSSTGLNFIHLSSRTNSYKYSFYPRTIVDWNDLPVEVKSAPSIDSFRDRLNNYLHYHPSYHSLLLH